MKKKKTILASISNHFEDYLYEPSKRVRAKCSNKTIHKYNQSRPPPRIRRELALQRPKRKKRGRNGEAGHHKGDRGRGARDKHEHKVHQQRHCAKEKERQERHQRHRRGRILFGKNLELLDHHYVQKHLAIPHKNGDELAGVALLQSSVHVK